MSKNIEQIFVANPATTVAATDLFYLGRSPYGAADDFAITGANLMASINPLSQVVNVSTSTQAMSPNTIYVADSASLVTLTLPLTAPFGSIISVVGFGPGGWKIAQNASNQVIVSPQNTSLGVAGSISSTDEFDTLTLICIVANFIWTAYGAPQSQGLTFV